MQTRTLSQRELEVLAHISLGLPYKVIATECGITMDTVAKHLRNIYKKMGVPNNAAAVAFALRNGILN
ncbi:MAG: response regulator transcription factor [Saprospiraceae bacterium]|nr:response regulator transcription factor [Saprospiraceae bacterium]